MTDKQAKLEVVGEPAKIDPTDVFNDLAALRKASKLTVQRKSVLVNVAVDRPANNVYFRCHPDLLLDDATVLRDDEGTSRTFYYVVPAMRAHPQLVPHLRPVTLGADQHMAGRQHPDLASADSGRARFQGLEIGAGCLRARA